jgi:hypothetical protein
MSAHYFKYLFALVFCVFFFNEKVHAQDMWGSGFYQGGMVCPYQTSVAKNATNISDEQKELRKDAQRERAAAKLAGSKMKRTEAMVDLLRKKIERYFDSSVSDFILDTHIEGAKLCSNYQSFRNGCLVPPNTNPAPAAGTAGAGTATAEAPARPADCDSKEAPPELLQRSWTEGDRGHGPYCNASSRSSAGGINPSICDDDSLRPQDGGRRGGNSSECKKSLAEYRKLRIQLANLADEQEDHEGKAQEKEMAAADERERAAIERQYRLENETESDCPECDAYSRGGSAPKLKRDWFSTATNVIGGLVYIGLGQKADSAGREQAAQLGMPAPTSYGYPYYQAGLNGVINGLAGPGAYGCSGGYGGAGFPFGAGGQFGIGGGPNGAYGPFAGQGGAFGYPQGMFGSPWGGGMYNPGLNINGGFNGPFGGTGFGGFPGNGNMAMCFTWPCNAGGPGFGGQLGGQIGGGFGGSPFGSPFGGSPFGSPFGGPGFGGQIGGGFGGSPFGSPFGSPYGGGQFGLNGQLSSQYQMQMMQLQMQMQQQYQQQQMQYYQAQQQAAMQYQQQQMQRQQQAYQIQMQISQLNMQLQQIMYSGSYGTSGGLNLSGGFNFGAQIGGSVGGSLGGSYGAPAPGGYPTGGFPGGGYNPGPFPPGYNTGPFPTSGVPSPTGVPSTTTGTRGR